MFRTRVTSPTKVIKTSARICPPLAAAAFALALIVPAGASAAADPSTPVQASAAQVAQYLFVAGDVGRLSQIPSGTEDLVLEKVLQELYSEQPALPPATAVSDIHALQAVLSSGSSAVSTETLTVMGGNERALAILRALTDSSQPADVQRALAQVTDHALVDSVQAAQGSGSSYQAFHPSVETISGQISSFEQYTGAAFKQVDEQLAGLSSQIAGLSGQIASLGAQISQIHDQLTSLQGDLSTLQSSVDHLQSELQSLFLADAQNHLQSDVNTYLGYAHKVGHPMTSDQFNAAAEMFYTDATNTAVSPTVLSTYQSSDFSASGALNPLRSLDMNTLDTNINYFEYFPVSVTDSPGSPVGWPDPVQDLTSSTTASGQPANACAANAETDQFLCRPNPDFWASATLAYTQLLAENPQYVNHTRLDELQSLTDDGKLISAALQRVSANDAGSDPAGTGSKLLDNAINYYDYWGASTQASPSQPSLYQALRNEERRYLASQGDTGVNPWGGMSQSPDLNGLVSSKLLPQDVPPCPEASGLVKQS